MFSTVHVKSDNCMQTGALQVNDVEKRQKYNYYFIHPLPHLGASAFFLVVADRIIVIVVIAVRNVIEVVIVAADFFAVFQHVSG